MRVPRGAPTGLCHHEGWYGTANCLSAAAGPQPCTVCMSRLALELQCTPAVTRPSLLAHGYITRSFDLLKRENPNLFLCEISKFFQTQSKQASRVIWPLGLMLILGLTVWAGG